MTKRKPMTRRFPIFATVLVLAAVGTMISLGFWQIRRLHEKEALLSHYAAAVGQNAEVPWPTTAKAGQAQLYRHSRVDCLRVTDRGGMAGRNARGESGLAQYVHCMLADGTSAKVVLGWSVEPLAGQGWNGGEVYGVIAPGPRLVADPPLAGLQANALPDPSEIPNNHFAYAVQWFLFAATALVIYGIALWKRAR
jgi:cytochrome oxidase assembly protein ShyY1